MSTLLPVALGMMALAGIATAIWIRWSSAHTARLQASEARFRDLLDNAIEGVYETPPAGGFRQANRALARMLGYPDPAQLLALRPDQTREIYVEPTRRDEFFAQLGTQDELANFESEIRRPDGSRMWIMENVRAVRDANGTLQYVQGFVSDITARKRAEAALKSSEERYRVLFEHMPIGVVEFDYTRVASWLDELRQAGVTDIEAWLADHAAESQAPGHRVAVVGANRAALRLFGAGSLGEGIAGLARMGTPEAMAAMRRTFGAIWRGAMHVDGEFTVTTLDGRTLCLFYYWQVPKVEQRPFYERTQLALIDTTEVKAAGQALAAERERLSVTLRAMSEAVITIDRGGVVQFMNDAAAELTGWTTSAAVGHALGEICLCGAASGQQPLTAPVTAALSAGRPVDLPPHTKLQPRTGAPRQVEGRCAPIRNESGEAIGVVLVLRDVTQSSRLEADLLRASKMESIGVLAGGIAHDFNNLLTVVMGNLTLALLDPNVRQAGERWLREAERSTLRAKELTQQLLTFAKGGEPVRSAVVLSEVVREAAEFALHGANVRCDFDIAAELKPADADKGQIGQAVQNLMINAVQAMPGGGSIRLVLGNDTLAPGTIPTLPAGEYVRLEISDTGPGIAPTHLSRIFEPFFTTKEYGTGLGLATVYSVVQKHHGHIAVESTLGRGTTFRIWLPTARPEPNPTMYSNSPFEPIRGRVLFMDDEEPIRVMTKALLERLGLEVTVSGDGTEAVRAYAMARLAGQPYSVVVVDLTVPGAMGGAEAMREILKIDPTARGIVSSGYSSDPVMANFRAHGFRGSVPKPYRLADFARTIREVLSV